MLWAVLAPSASLFGPLRSFWVRPSTSWFHCGVFWLPAWCSLDPRGAFWLHCGSFWLTVRCSPAPRGAFWLRCWPFWFPTHVFSFVPVWKVLAALWMVFDSTAVRFGRLRGPNPGSMRRALAPLRFVVSSCAVLPGVMRSALACCGPSWLPVRCSLGPSGTFCYIVERFDSAAACVGSLCGAPWPSLDLLASL